MPSTTLAARPEVAVWCLGTAARHETRDGQVYTTSPRDRRQLPSMSNVLLCCVSPHCNTQNIPVK